jgi:hypothetical protein
MAEFDQQLPRPSIKSIFEKINVKAILKWTTYSLLVIILFRIAWSLVEELRSVHKIGKEVEEAAGEMRSYQVSIWSTHVLYFAYILLAIYATIKEKYPLLLSFSVVDLILDFIYLFDCEGILIYIFEISVTIMCFVTAIYFRFNQNIPWNPL